MTSRGHKTWRNKTSCSEHQIKVAKSSSGQFQKGSEELVYLGVCVCVCGFYLFVQWLKSDSITGHLRVCLLTQEHYKSHGLIKLLWHYDRARSGILMLCRLKWK